MFFSLPAISQAESYTYDDTGRLTSVVYDDGSRIAYTYDNAGNILQQQAGTVEIIDTDGDGIPDIDDAFPSGRFDDVPLGYWAFLFVEKLANAGITGGCGNNNYCPNDSVTRAQMAVFLERGMKGSGYQPSAAKGTVFNDVGQSSFAAAWIEQLFADGITSGCGNGNYCGGAAVNRAQMAVFLLRAKYGRNYSPPAATGEFLDVAANNTYAGWIEQLADEGITSGCGNGNYCPNNVVTRAQMAVFLVRAFDL